MRCNLDTIRPRIKQQESRDSCNLLPVVFELRAIECVSRMDSKIVSGVAILRVAHNIVIGNVDSSEVEQHVVVRAKAKDVRGFVRPVVWSTQTTDMRTLAVQS